ncbi:DNA-binding protein, excisionase family [Frankia sp. EI5c]|uniref:helix-turn-helix domain-containing protein n=1 Tax=Frankia sp. EI5c TaxID=683316 RepID=UPI0007C3759B|nr:helix-turn-helix domain-containing protein [Frankia sp. EI5c]OAA24558.1 DNA-binding protein, excisionase family [Frankia sp. EI5c]
MIEDLATAEIPTDQLDDLERFARGDAGPQLRDLLLGLSRCIRDGATITATSGAASLTPSQAAERLGMSRTHLYKLLDRGEIPSHRVGRDRRIQLRDLARFEAERQHDRRELAERFATQHRTRAAAVDEIADLL